MLQLRLRLRSDATFSSGDGIAGWIDTDIEHDENGFPLVRGRTLKGVLVEECANILWSLRLQQQAGSLAANDLQTYEKAAHFLFGSPGSQERDRARMQMGPAQFPSPLRAVVAYDMRHGDEQTKPTPAAVLESLTAIRRQSAIDETNGAPEDGSLRALRVLLHDTELAADLTFESQPDADARALLAACVYALRRGGLGRNRGRGRLRCSLWDTVSQQEITERYLGEFPARSGSAHGSGGVTGGGGV